MGTQKSASILFKKNVFQQWTIFQLARAVWVILYVLAKITSPMFGRPWQRLRIYGKMQIRNITIGSEYTDFIESHYPPGLDRYFLGLRKTDHSSFPVSGVASFITYFRRADFTLFLLFQKYVIKRATYDKD